VYIGTQEYIAEISTDTMQLAVLNSTKEQHQHIAVCMHCTVLEITVGHWPFPDQFQYLANQNPFWSANFTVYLQWDGNQ